MDEDARENGFFGLDGDNEDMVNDLEQEREHFEKIVGVFEAYGRQSLHSVRSCCFCCLIYILV